MKKPADNPPYVWVIEKRTQGYGCIVRRFAFVKRNRVSITVVDHGVHKTIYDNSATTFVYTPELVRPAVIGHMRNQRDRLKKDLAKLEAAIDTPEVIIMEVDDMPYRVPEGPLELD